MKITSDLLKQCQKNDRKAQNELYRQCFSFLMGISLRYAKDREEAKALVNFGFFKIVTNLEKYSEEIVFEVWVRRIMINCIIDEYRKDRKRREHQQTTDFSEAASFLHPVDFNQAAKEIDAEQLEIMIRKLPAMSQKVFNLYAIDGYSHKEIAEMLGISDGTSKWHVSFARKSLQQMLKDYVNAFKTVLP